MGHYSSGHNKTSDWGHGYDRLRVDVAQTSFFEGREFRMFKELNIPASSIYVIKAVVPINIILHHLECTLDQGHVRVATVVGGESGGDFSETLPVLGANNMAYSPDDEARRRDFGDGDDFYQPQVTLTAGGTHTGGTIIDVLRIKVATNSNFAASVGTSLGDERGIAINTYHFRLENLGSDIATGTFKGRWEERP
jgi:hypothetical protein